MLKRGRRQSHHIVRNTYLFSGWRRGMNNIAEPEFIELEGEQVAAFVERRSGELSLVIPEAHRAVVIENLLILQAHAKFMTDASEVQTP